MPAHAVLGSIGLLLAALAALTALMYAVAPSVRPVLRWPLVIACVLAFAATVVAGEAGGTLLKAVEATGPPGEVAAARAHGHGSGVLTTAAFLLLAVILSTVWGPLHPTKGRRGVWAAVVVVVAVGTLVAAGVVLGQALDAVTAGNPAWQVS
jgi:hypothetical protein